jgi:hypothetical protein
MSRLVAKNPVFSIPRLRKSFAVNRAFGLGLSSFLKNGKTEDGMDPREEGDGGGCGGWAVGGGGCEGLKMACKRRPSA